MQFDETKVCFIIKPDGKGRPFKIYSTDVNGVFPQFVPMGFVRFYEKHSENFKKAFLSSENLTKHGKEFFATQEGLAYLEKLEDFAKYGKRAPKFLNKT